MIVRRFPAAATIVLAATLALTPAVLPQAPGPYTVLTGERRQPLPVRSIGGHEMVALDDLASLFDLTPRDDSLAGGLTISTKSQTITLTPGQTLVSVGGRLVSLPAPAVRDGRSWFVPVEFISRALGPALGTRLDVRRASRLIVAGDLRVPRVVARVEPLGSAARVTLDVTPMLPHSVVQEAGRLVVRFEADAIDATLPPSPVPELVQGIRRLEPGVGIAIELGPRFATHRTTEAPGERGSGRIMLDVAPAAPATTTAEPATPAPVAAPVPAPPAADPPLITLTPPGGIRTIVIDPGHGGEDEGAHGPQGTAEKTVTMSVARRLKAAIETRLGARVILTRDGDRTIAFDERAAMANNNKADLFLSLHANASLRPAAAGAEVFHLSLADYGDEARRIAEGNRDTLPTFSGGTREIEVILWEMAQARHIERSAQFAAFVEAALRARVPMSPRALQQAPFRVLVGVNMPAVLVEMGFLTNPDQEKQLASDSFQSTLVQALLEAILNFRAASAPADTAATGARN